MLRVLNDSGGVHWELLVYTLKSSLKGISHHNQHILMSNKYYTKQVIFKIYNKIIIKKKKKLEWLIFYYILLKKKQIVLNYILQNIIKYN
jgi:hypothetical protein